MVGIAVGTVLLPEMSRRLAAGDEKGAASAQARGIQLALLLTVPCAAASIAIPDLIMRALFARGAFTAADAAAAGATLAAYAFGLLPFVLLRSFTSPFYARGDTATPVKAALLAASINILLKVLLMGHLAQVGLAAATSVGAWINLSLLAYFARRQGFAVSGADIGKPVVKLLFAGAVLAVVLLGASYALERALAHLTHFHDETILLILFVLGTIVYGGAVLLLLGLPWLKSLLREVTRRGRDGGASRARAGRSDRRLGRASRFGAAAEGLARLFRQQVHELDRLRVDRAPKEDLADAGEALRRIGREEARLSDALRRACEPPLGKRRGDSRRRRFRRVDERDGVSDALADRGGEHREMRAAEHERVRRVAPR